MMLRGTVRMRMAAFCLIFTLGMGAFAAGKWEYKPSSAERKALAGIVPESLQAHLSFLSADALEGRGSGSSGLDVAAEYIAAQFRRAGLKPAGDDGYFQTTPRIRLAPSMDGYLCRLSLKGRVVDVSPRQFALVGNLGGSPAIREFSIENASVVKVPFGGPLPDQIADARGTAVFTEIPAAPSDAAERSAFLERRRTFVSWLNSLKPALFVEIRRDPAWAIDYFAGSQLIDPQMGRRLTGLPGVAIFDGSAVEAYDALPAGSTSALFSVRLAPPVESDAPQRNVIGMLPGSDPKLADRYVLVTAHYDGQGSQLRPIPDRIWNSANDNGSGTVTVIELAAALASLPKHPRRSVVFIAFHGEEGGLAGSRYYAEHPVFPLAKTVAGINVEMVGRTDDVEGDQHKRASVTGFDYSDVGEIFRLAGEQTGLTVFKHPKKSDPYFAASDNAALAVQGVPCHTVCVTFQYPDYHGPADTWQKIDYDNMALTVRMIATALLILSQNDEEPRWNPDQKNANRYLEAWKKLHETENR